MSLDLCIDPLGCEFPGLVNEILALPTDNVDRPMMLACSLTTDGFAYLLCNKVLYVWSYLTSEKGINPHAYRLNLPTTGLNYSLNSIVVMNKDGNPLPSVLAVSPEGLLRYWPSLGSSIPRDKEMNLNNEVVHSVILFGEEDHVTRYILATTTGSFYHIDIFKENYFQGVGSDNAIAYRSIGINSTSLARQMISGILGGTQKKQGLVKIIRVKDLFASSDADLVAVYQTTIEICSTKKANVVKNIDARDYILRSFLEAQCSSIPMDSRRTPTIYIADVIQHLNGFLVLFGVAKHNEKFLSFGLAYLTEESIHRNHVKFVTVVTISEQHKLPVPQKDQLLPKINIYTPIPTNFIIVFPSMVVSLENVNTDDETICDVTKFREQLLGSSCVNQFCQVILRRKGICDVRHLPIGFDITFWQKYQAQVESIECEMNPNFARIQKVFTLFASKQLADARSEFVKMFKSFDDINDLAELMVIMTKQVLDRVPPNDPRWIEGVNKRTTRGSSVRSVSIKLQLEDKLAHYKMIIMFLRYFGLLDKLNHPLKTFNGRSALTVIGEYGEKLYAMTLIIGMTSQLTLQIVEKSIKFLAQDIQTQLRLYQNHSLSDHDFFAKEVTSIEALIPTIMRIQQEELRGKNKLAQLNIFTEVISLFTIIVEAKRLYTLEDWVIQIKSDEPIWTNSQQVLTHFNRQFNLVFDFIEHERGASESLFKKLLTIARFILSQQSHFQRNRSSIIQRIYHYGKIDTAIKLAEEFFDFATLIQHCYEQLPDVERQYQLEKYKAKFKSENFDLFLFEYYREHGLITDLLEQQGDRVEDFLAKHDEINWIRNIERREYTKAKETLQSIAYSAPNASRKKTILSLAKLAALCEDEQNPEELAQITNSIILLEHQEQIAPEVVKFSNPTNAPLSIDEIVSANISENTAEGFIKALMTLTTVLDTRESKTDLGLQTVDKLRNRIWTSLVKAADWNRIANEVIRYLKHEDAMEKFSEILANTFLADVMQRIIDYDIPTDCKLQLLPKSTEALKDVFPLKKNADAQHAFDQFIDTSMDEIRRSIEKENIQ